MLLKLFIASLCLLLRPKSQTSVWDQSITADHFKCKCTICHSLRAEEQLPWTENTKINASIFIVEFLHLPVIYYNRCEMWCQTFRILISYHTVVSHRSSTLCSQWTQSDLLSGIILLFYQYWLLHSSCASRFRMIAIIQIASCMFPNSNINKCETSSHPQSDFSWCITWWNLVDSPFHRPCDSNITIRLWTE